MKRTQKPFLASMVVLVVASFYTLQKYIKTNQAPYFINWPWSETISCHYVTEGDALPPAEGLDMPEDSIFFHETSCRGGLNSREACAVESAARKHPERLVAVFFNSPVSEVVLRRSCLAKLNQMENVILARVHTAEYAKGTALSELLGRKENERSKWQIELTSDMLRYITLYKFGGVYLDTDVLVVRPLDSLGKNWVAIQDLEMVNVAVMAISKDGVGHELVTRILDDLKSDYRPSKWQHHGPGAMTRGLFNLCKVNSTEEMVGGRCHGFRVFLRPFLYPVHWYNAETYFNGRPVTPDEVQELINQPFTHHLWNKLTKNMTVEKGSLFDTLAWQHCPSIREMYGDQFGS